MFFDDIAILRTIDRQELAEQLASLHSGTSLLREFTGGQNVADEADLRRFIRELAMARDEGWVDFEVPQWGFENIDRMGALNHLEHIRDIRLRPRGRDRARCRVFQAEPPDPGEDDGSPITLLAFTKLAEIMAATYPPERLRLFLEDAGIPVELIPDLSDPERGLMQFFDAFDGPADHRRVIRQFLGQWLSQGLASGPDQDQERELLADLARQGWFIRNDRLVRGEPIRRATIAPLLGGDLLVNLHPSVHEAVRPLFTPTTRAAAVFEAFKAIEQRVREMIGSDKSGVPLMGEAFDTDQPRIRLNDLSDPTNIDEQRGFALIFKGAMLGIRNPKAHARFEELEERRALDYLGLASLLMRRLDDAGER